MGFKADASFLRFVTMGAAGARRTMELLQKLQFAPIELERYATSNKIWATKIKRLRLPDLLCVRTGLRVEVKAKSSLAVKMSDAPANPDRVWHAGLRDEDVIAFITAREVDGALLIAQDANFFRVDALTTTEAHSRLGPPKSAGEGSERDREWSTYVPAVDGRVLEVVMNGLTPTHLRLELSKPGGGTRSQTYILRGKHPYVGAGDRFVGGESIIAGVAPAKADLSSYLGRQYNPLVEIERENIIDRYAAVRALPHRPDLVAIAGQAVVVGMLEERMREEADGRLRLEAAASAAALGSDAARETLRAFIADPDEPALRLEAVFVLTELHRGISAGTAADALQDIANNQNMSSELRQAAVWGLGFSGHGQFGSILPFLDDADENVALHAIAAFGPAAPESIVGELVARLDERSPRLAAAASEALRLIATDLVIAYVAAAMAAPLQRAWALATLGRLDPVRVRALVADPATLAALAPLFRVFSSENWLATGDRLTSLTYLFRQRF